MSMKTMPDLNSVFSQHLDNLHLPRLGNMTSLPTSSFFGGPNLNFTAAGENANSSSLTDVNLKKILDDFRTNLDSSGAIGNAAFYSLCAIYTFAIVVGLCGNILIVTAVLGRKRMRTARNVFIVTLAISDLILCTFTMPSTLWEVLYRKWPFGDHTEWLCRLANSTKAIPMFLSSFAITAIALDRFRCIMQPDKTQLTAKYSCLISVLMVFLAIGMTIPLFVGTKLKDYVDFEPTALNDIALCSDVRSGHMRLVYDITRCVVQFVCPLLVVLCVYISIFWRLKSRPVSQHSANHKRRRRTNIMIILVSVTFFSSWLPLNALHFFLDMKSEDVNIVGEIQGVDPLLYGLCNIIGLSNACINPVLYGFLNESFRREYKSIFRRLPMHSSHAAAAIGLEDNIEAPAKQDKNVESNPPSSPSNKSLRLGSKTDEAIPLQTFASKEPSTKTPPPTPTLTMSTPSAPLSVFPEKEKRRTKSFIHRRKNSEKLHVVYDPRAEDVFLKRVKVTAV